MQLESRMSRVAVTKWVPGTIQHLPLGSKVGLLVMALGLGTDLVAHLGPGLAHDHGVASGVELTAHLIVFVGMALVLIGVVVDGVRAGRQSSGQAIHGRRSDAVR
jgi:hypothetical protein